MAGAIIEIKYFNTFILKKTNSTSQIPVWNGSFGIPETIGGYPVLSSASTDKDDSWVIEESRIRGGYNNTSVDFGAKAYIVEDEPVGTRRFNTLIYSGIFNSRTGINNTNVFSVGEDITKSLDPANGSIQKLYAEDTNLNIFQELKVSRALIDKDAIYSAEGGGTVTSSNLVIGAISPYLGKYGISTNPESFGVYGNKKYFTDRNNNVVLRLSRDGITEISSYGMKDFFRDNLALARTISTEGKILGSYDIYASEYVVSIQNPQLLNSPFRLPSNNTLNFDERAQGWVSFFDYVPDEMFSLRNNFYSVKTLNAEGETNGSVTGSTSLNISVFTVKGFIRQGAVVTTIGSGIPANTTVVSFNELTGALIVSNPVTVANNTILNFSSFPQLWRHYSSQVKRGSYYGIDNSSSITFVFNPNPTNSKTFKTIGYEGSNGWQVDSIKSDQTGEIFQTNAIAGGFQTSQDSAAFIKSYHEGEYVLTEASATVLQDVTDSAVVQLNPSGLSGYIFIGNTVFSEEIDSSLRTVVSFNGAGPTVTLSQPVTLTAGSSILFNGEVPKVDYNSVFGSVLPPVDKYYTGFNLKENKYVANLINNTVPTLGEINFGKAVSGIKGFYTTVKMSTDSTTDLGGEKTLFSVESINNKKIKA